jgi:hypothetical protein
MVKPAPHKPSSRVRNSHKPCPERHFRCNLTAESQTLRGPSRRSVSRSPFATRGLFMLVSRSPNLGRQCPSCPCPGSTDIASPKRKRSITGSARCISRISVSKCFESFHVRSPERYSMLQKKGCVAFLQDWILWRAWGPRTTFSLSTTTWVCASCWTDTLPATVIGSLRWPTAGKCARLSQTTGSI